MTIGQLIRNGRHSKPKKKSRILDGSPFKIAICKKVLTMKPKKPNSALRAIAYAEIKKTKQRFKVFIPGEKHTLQEHASILVRRGNRVDLPGVQFIAVRNARGTDLKGVEGKMQSRSRYGTPKPKPGATPAKKVAGKK